MAEQKIATERVFAEAADGVERLAAAPGDPIPDEVAALGYREAIDTRADTADAAIVRGEVSQLQDRVKNARTATLAPDEYADPLPKPGEEVEKKATRSADVEDKARQKRS